MCRDTSDPNRPDIGTFHSSYDVVFIDPTGYHNLCSNMLDSTYYRVRTFSCYCFTDREQTEWDCREWKLSAMDPHDRDT